MGPGTRIGEYEIIETIGYGGMGSVLKARHRLMKRIVAIKTIRYENMTDPATISRFRREIEASARLSHANVLTVFDAGIWNHAQPFLVTEYISGGDLANFVKVNGRLKVEDALNFILQAGAGLAEIHEAGIVHRDIKPHNLLIDGRGTIQISDFGLARFLDRSNPKQIGGEAKPKDKSPDHHLSDMVEITDDSGLSIRPNVPLSIKLSDSKSTGSDANSDDAASVNTDSVDAVPGDANSEDAASAHDNSIVNLMEAASKPTGTVTGFVRRVMSSQALETCHELPLPSPEPDFPGMEYDTPPGAICGTPGFGSPEQFLGRQADERSDVFSLGATLFYLLVAKAMYASNGLGELIKDLTNLEVPCPSLADHRDDLPLDLDSVFQKMVAKDPERRFRSMSETISALKSVGGTPNIFISYRRNDSLDATDRLYSALRKRYRADSLFLDVDTIPPGVDFRIHLRKAVEKCDVMLVVIGDHWTSERLKNPADFVRLEIEFALELNIDMIPVLVGRAEMPFQDELPQSLHPFVFRNAIEVRAGMEYDSHINRLANGIDLLWDARRPRPNLD